MGKKSKKKFNKKRRKQKQQTQNPATSTISPSITTVQATQTTPPEMSGSDAVRKQKNRTARKSAATVKQETIYAAHAKEYRFITGDLYRVLVVNGLFLIGIVVLYFINRSNPFLQSWYNQLLG